MSDNPYRSMTAICGQSAMSGSARKLLLPSHIITATVLSALIVALPMGVALFVPYLILVAVVWRREAKRGRQAATVLTYFLITASVVVGAALAPVKTTERILEERLHLPKTEFTLAELDDEARFEQGREWLPRFVRIGSTPDNTAQSIHFRSTKITLREFIETIESQSNLRHRVAHCGNGSSVLFGGDACFGLYLQERHPGGFQP